MLRQKLKYSFLGLILVTIDSLVNKTQINNLGYCGFHCFIAETRITRLLKYVPTSLMICCKVFQIFRIVVYSLSFTVSYK